MTPQRFSQFVLSVVIFMLAMEFCNAMISYRGCDGREKDGQNDPMFLWGRKLLQELKPKLIEIEAGKSKSVQLNSSVPLPKSESDHIQKPTAEAKKIDRSKAFLEAAEEVANLMSKDYNGPDRPRRKPPINNHVPKN